MSENKEMIADQVKAISQEVKDSFAKTEAAFAELKSAIEAGDEANSEAVEAVAEEMAKTQKKHDEMVQKQAKLIERQDALELALRNAPRGESQKERVDQVKAAADFERLSNIRGQRRSDDTKAPNAEAYAAYRKSMNEYLRRGEKAVYTEAHQKALTYGNDTEGGYLVPVEMASSIVERIYEDSSLRSVANVQQIGGSIYKIPVAWGRIGSGWVGETQNREETGTGQPFKEVAITAHELYAYPIASLSLLEDSAVNLEDWIGKEAGNEFARDENAAFISGDGNGKPRGVLTYPVGSGFGMLEAINSGIAGGVNYDSFVNLITGLKTGYQSRAAFLTSRLGLAMVMKLKDGEGRPLWLPSLTEGAPSTLLGRSVVIADDVPGPGVNTVAFAYGDFQRGYTIVDRIGLNVIRDDVTKPGFVRWNIRKRVGGGVVDFDAIKVMPLSA